MAPQSPASCWRRSRFPETRSMDAADAPSRRQLLWLWIEQRLPALLRGHRAESLPIMLNQRRIYIVPSGFGVFFAVVMFAVLIGALNYQNNMALLFGLLSTSIAAVSMVQTFRNLDQLSLVQVTVEPGHVGEPLPIALHLRAADGRARYGISLRLGTQWRHLDLPAGQTAIVHFTASAQRRGWFSPEPVTISTRWPFGLFYAWSSLQADARALVYPRAESPPAPFPRHPRGGRQRGSDPGDEDLRALRGYVAGDPSHLVAWKASARLGQLLVRQLETPRSREAIFDYAQITELDSEGRLSRLTRWVIEAERAGMPWRLQLPGIALGPDRGPAHRLRCLQALALYALPDSRQ